MSAGFRGWGRGGGRRQGRGGSCLGGPGSRGSRTGQGFRLLFHERHRGAAGTGPGASRASEVNHAQVNPGPSGPRRAAIAPRIGRVRPPVTPAVLIAARRGPIAPLPARPGNPGACHLAPRESPGPIRQVAGREAAWPAAGTRAPKPFVPSGPGSRGWGHPGLEPPSPAIAPSGRTLGTSGEGGVLAQIADGGPGSAPERN